MTCCRCRCHWRRDVRWRLQLHELHQTVALWTGALHIAGPKEVFQLNLLKKEYIQRMMSNNQQKHFCAVL